MAEPTLDKTPSWISPNRYVKETVVITDRSYDQVARELRFPKTFFKPGMRMLSIGEGLSNYSKTLYNKFAVDVRAMDPIYKTPPLITRDRGGNEKHVSLFSRSPKRVAQVISAAYDGVEFRHKAPGTRVPLPDKDRVLVGSVYKLPFSGEAFDCISAQRLVEHIDLATALPEMLRVVKPDGEIRLGEPLLEAQPEKSFLLPGRVFRDGDLGGTYGIQSPLGFANIVQLLSDQNASLYITLDWLPDYSMSRSKGYYMVGNLIIRKDQAIPQYIQYTQEELDQDVRFKTEHQRGGPRNLSKNPYFGSMFKVNFEPQDLSEFGLPVYPMTQVYY